MAQGHWHWFGRAWVWRGGGELCRTRSVLIREAHTVPHTVPALRVGNSYDPSPTHAARQHSSSWLRILDGPSASARPMLPCSETCCLARTRSSSTPYVLVQ
eukprot:COSAG01_NODE_11442_length_1933_cov_2.837514_2_plen_101_part_00